MWSPSRRTYYVFPSILLLSILLLNGCSKKEQNEPEQQPETEVPSVEETIDTRAIVFSTDSDEWMVQLFKEHLLYSEAVETNLPAPWVIPSREEAQILKTCNYPHDERFITSDGYTFGMPSASVSKAGSKTYYSVLGLHIRRTVIVVTF